VFVHRKLNELDETAGRFVVLVRLFLCLKNEAAFIHSARELPPQRPELTGFELRIGSDQVLLRNQDFSISLKKKMQNVKICENLCKENL
jgi:hypothetical protein